MNQPGKTIGILALQGAFEEHYRTIVKLGFDAKEIRRMRDTEGIDAVIIPGGESTTLLKLLKKAGLDEWLKEASKKGMPIFGTCAGMIVLSQLGLIDVETERNAYGSQINSFEAELKMDKDAKPYPGVFIRAPKIKNLGKSVNVVVKLEENPVLVRQGSVLAGSFHPELTEDTRIHQYFLKSV